MLSFIVMAAGLGTRMGSDTHKCLSLVKGKPFIFSVLDAGIHAECDEIIIVIGHKAQEIRDTVGNEYSGVPVIYVFNPDYEKGSVLSLIDGITRSSGDRFLITEGDCRVPLFYYKGMVNCSLPTVLIRPNEVDKTKSVLVTSKRPGLVSRFVYDTNHKDVTGLVDSRETIVGESAQVWYIPDEFTDHIRFVANMCIDQQDETNLLPFNTFLESSDNNRFIMYHAKSENLINLNKPSDVELANNIEWL